MIKRSVIVFLVLLLILPIVLAVEVDMNTEFSQGETFMAKVSGNFVEPVLQDNIFFYRGHVRIPMNPGVSKIDDEYYIYAQLLDKEPNNYSISIEDVKYMKGTQIIEDNIVRNFTITNETADFNVNPGSLLTQSDFSITVQNLVDSKITINVNTETVSGDDSGTFESLFGGEKIQSGTSVTLKSGEVEKINFQLIDMTGPTIKSIKLSTENTDYDIPVYILVNKTEEDTEDEDYEFDLPELFISMPTESEAVQIIYLVNTGDIDLENITLSISEQLEPYVELSIDEIDLLKKDSSKAIEIYFFSDSDERILEGQLRAKTSEGMYAYSSIFLDFLEDYIPDDVVIVKSSKTCLEMNGKICSDNEKCNEETYKAKDSVCCLGECEEVKTSSTGKIIGWTIIIVIIIFLLWFFKSKYTGARRTNNLLNLLSKRK